MWSLAYYSKPEFQIHQKTLFTVVINSIRIAILPFCYYESLGSSNVMPIRSSSSAPSPCQIVLYKYFPHTRSCIQFTTSQTFHCFPWKRVDQEYQETSNHIEYVIPDCKQTKLKIISGPCTVETFHFQKNYQTAPLRELLHICIVVGFPLSDIFT